MSYSEWDAYRGKIRSKKGGWRVGKKVESHGYDLINDLIGHYSYMQILVLNATGRMPNRNLTDWLEAVHISMSWPDSRIWCNRVGALAGSSGANAVASVCAGLMTADSRNHGSISLIEGVKFIQQAKQAVDSGISIETFIAQAIEHHGGKPNLMGYTRPIAKGDERIPVLETVASDLGFKKLHHLNLAYQIRDILMRDFDEFMHLNGYVSAFMSDQGFSPMEVYRIFVVLPFSGITACYVDVSDRLQGSFAPMYVDDIKYSGLPDREL